MEKSGSLDTYRLRWSVSGLGVGLQCVDAGTWL